MYFQQPVPIYPLLLVSLRNKNHSNEGIFFLPLKGKKSSA